ncbi:MAG TPA: class IV adenylate cyclase, partial [Gemmatimonadaceae bacterium]
MSSPTREVELKARVDDVAGTREKLARSGATLVFDGRLHDRIYDTASRTLDGQDLVLRLRTYESESGTVAHLDWKGPTTRENGFKVRAELTTGVSDSLALAGMLERLGYHVVREIDRSIAQYEFAAGAECAVVRFEEYPRMDVLVEVEGTPASIEDAIRALGISRELFSAGRLSDFVQAYEKRTGLGGALCD